MTGSLALSKKMDLSLCELGERQQDCNCKLYYPMIDKDAYTRIAEP